jgi:Glyoxalase/Bleomycin resistance protein/Dioxygenase superfamily
METYFKALGVRLGLLCAQLVATKFTAIWMRWAWRVRRSIAMQSLLHLWQGHADAGFQQGSIIGVHHVAFICEDLQKSLHFYKEILGAHGPIAMQTSA